MEEQVKMREKKNIIAIVAVLLISIIVFTGCAGNDSKDADKSSEKASVSQSKEEASVSGEISFFAMQFFLFGCRFEFINYLENNCWPQRYEEYGKPPTIFGSHSPHPNNYFTHLQILSVQNPSNTTHIRIKIFSNRQHKKKGHPQTNVLFNIGSILLNSLPFFL